MLFCNVTRRFRIFSDCPKQAKDRFLSVTNTTPVTSTTAATIPPVTSTIPDPESIEPTITKNGSDTELGFVENWKRTSRMRRIHIGLYATGVVVTFALTIYDDGRNALEEHRGRKHFCPTYSNMGCKCDLRRSEYYAVKRECNRVWFLRFYESIFFPCVIMSSAIPHMILLADPAPTQETK